MDVKIKKLESILKKHEACENKRAVILVYLSVVLLNKSMDDVASFFKLPYNKVRYSVALMHRIKRKSKKFYLQMNKVFKEYNSDNELKLVA